MKKIIIALLALSLTLLPLTGFAAGGKSSMFGSDIGVSENIETPEDGEKPEWVPIEDPEPEPDLPAPASADGYTADEIRARVVEFLDSINWNYTEDNGEITFNMSIDSKLGSLSYRLRFFPNGYTAYAYPSLYADSTSAANIGEYLHRANYGMRNGNFEFDYTDGEIRYKSYVDCTNALPGDEVIRRTISVPGEMFEIYGDGLLQVSFGLQTPEEAISAAED